MNGEMTMSDQHDPVDSALKSLGGRRWPGEDQDNNQLKVKIMQDYSSKGSSSRHRGAIVAALAFLALGTVRVDALMYHACKKAEKRVCKLPTSDRTIRQTHTKSRAASAPDGLSPDE